MPNATLSEVAINWHTLSMDGDKILRDGYQVAERAMHCAFSILILPAFDDYLHLQVFQSSETYIAVHTLWKRSVDISKFVSPLERLKHPTTLYPTIEQQVIGLEVDFFQKIRLELSAFTLPLWVEDRGISLDGITYEFLLERGFFSVVYRWSTNPPTEYTALHEFVIRFRETIEESLWRGNKNG